MHRVAIPEHCVVLLSAVVLGGVAGVAAAAASVTTVLGVA